MAKVKKGAIIPNKHLDDDENATNDKFSQKYENQHSDESVEKNLRYEDPLTSQSKLPPKKRFGTTAENVEQQPKQPEMLNQRHKKISNPPEVEQNLQRTEPRKAKILPGVIRHTSCPDRSLAFYYNYSMNKK